MRQDRVRGTCCNLWRNRQKDGLTQIEGKYQTDELWDWQGWIDRQHIQTEELRDRPKDRLTERLTERQTDRHRLTDRQTWQTALVLAKFLFQIVSGLLQKWQDVSENGRSYWSPSVGGQRVNSTGRVSWWTEALINSHTTCLALEFSSLNLCNVFEKRSNLTKTWVSMCFSSGILPEFQS